MLEDDFRDIQCGVNGAMRTHNAVEELTAGGRALEDRMRVVEAQRLRLQQEVMAGREAGETMELAILELQRMKDGMHQTLEAGQHKVGLAMDMAERQVAESEALLHEAQVVAAEERRQRQKAEEAMRNHIINNERVSAHTAGHEREINEAKKHLMAEKISLEEMNGALKRELNLSETQRRHTEAESEMQRRQLEAVACANAAAPLALPSPTPVPGADSEELMICRVENDALRREVTSLTATLCDLSEEKDHMQGLLRATTGLTDGALGKISTAAPPRNPASPKLQLSPGPRPSQVSTPGKVSAREDVKEAEHFFRKQKGRREGQ